MTPSHCHVGVKRELGLYGLKPAVGLQRLVGLVKQRRLGPQELLVSRKRWLVVRLRPRRSALLHELTEVCGLLVAPGEHGRNGLGQLRRNRWFSHSAFNHD